jgi:hypothetical protein
MKKRAPTFGDKKKIGGNVKFEKDYNGHAGDQASAAAETTSATSQV